MAASLAYTGVLLKLSKLQVGSTLWIPVAGDLLLLLSAFLAGGAALRLLCTGLMLTGILNLMVPDSFLSASLMFALSAVYLAVVTLDALSRRLPGRVPRTFGAANLLALDTLCALDPLGTLRALHALTFHALGTLRALHALTFHALWALGALRLLAFGALRTFHSRAAIALVAPAFGGCRSAEGQAGHTGNQHHLAGHD